MEGLINKAEYIIDKSYDTLIRGGCGYLLGQPLFRKLAEIYAEEAAKAPRIKSISLTHKLLEKLVKRDNLNCLVVNLYKGNEGYSLVVRLGSGIETETVRLQYEDEEFLSFIDNEQLPPMLLDLLDEANIDIFYSGCIISEIRDYRRSLDSSYESKYILLKPTNQSLVADIASLTRDKDWTPMEKLQLEAEIVKKTAPPLNLCPSPIVALINNKLHQHKYKFSGVQLRRAARRFSQVAQNRQKKFEDSPNSSILKLQGFLSEKKDKRPYAKTITRPMIPLIGEDPNPGVALEGKPKSEIDKFYQKVTEDVKRLAQPLERLQDTKDSSLDVVEEYTLETERGQGRIYLTNLFSVL
ncbi:Transcription factor SPT20-like protein [Armadillidium nasatum]|uniref:Transcription factor SPT20-like protein n=1 Tax=Armadillidium nasatum TaxID=96803 RepID=A0A5N5SZ20_9CRUS|nr:Transcription factor SPT20-like protein [Armadillidium nasatum]